MKAKVWEEDIIIPTYEIGAPEKNPMFLEKRVYQGSSGVVYPYPVIEKISDEKIDKKWHAVFLENEYLKIMILPELGGRVQMAYDKIKERHFIYYNSVIKPAPVGLTGPWISGGIEFTGPNIIVRVLICRSISVSRKTKSVALRFGSTNKNECFIKKPQSHSLYIPAGRYWK